jgi:hypothetical protein
MSGDRDYPPVSAYKPQQRDYVSRLIIAFYFTLLLSPPHTPWSGSSTGSGSRIESDSIASPPVESRQHVTIQLEKRSNLPGMAVFRGVAYCHYASLAGHACIHDQHGMHVFMDMQSAQHTQPVLQHCCCCLTGPTRAYGRCQYGTAHAGDTKTNTSIVQHIQTAPRLHAPVHA